MANTTITGPQISDIILQGDDKAFISDNRVRKEAALTVLTLYGFDSDETDILDFGGAVKVITLTGIYVDTSEANVKTFLDSVEALIQGKQDILNGYPLLFTDDRRGALKVKFMDFDSSIVAGFPLGATWSLKMFESSSRA